MTGFIVPGNLKYAPYVRYYMDEFKKNNADFEIISWDKNGLSEDEVDHVFHYKVSDMQRKKVLWGYLGFSRFAKKICRKKKYDNLVVFTIAPAVFMSTFLLRKYNKNYILDIRDDSPFVRKTPKIFMKVRDGAKDLVSSSRFFFKWIGKECYMCHNCDAQAISDHRDDELNNSVSHPIRIVFAGIMNEARINVWMLRQIKSYDDFDFYFWGPKSEGMEDVSRLGNEMGIKNLHFGGRYNKQDIVKIYRENADFVNIIRKKSEVNRNALPNKLYDAAIAGKPVIVFDHNEAVCEYVEKYGLGIILSEEDSGDFENVLKRKISEFSMEHYEKGRIAFIDELMKDREEFNLMVKRFLANN